MINIQKQRKQGANPPLAQPLAQAEGSCSGERDFRLGELSSPRRELDNLEQWPLALACLGEISSSERGILSLKTRMARLSDNSRRRLGRASTSLA